MNYENIPTELKALKQWTVFNSYPGKSGKYIKVMKDPKTGGLAKSNEPQTWGNFYSMEYYYKRGCYQGLAFVLHKGIVFIDLDHAIDKTSGEIISPKAKRLLELLPDTYTERSVSGTGIHILFRGELPSDAKKRSNSKDIEIYDNRRFVCMTGDIIDNRRELKDYSDKVDEIIDNFIGRKEPAKSYFVAPSNTSDTELIKEICDSRQAAKFRALYYGDTSAYPSHSHADSALVYMLAWWTQDPAQIDSIFRSSGLYRPKWDSMRGNATYSRHLIGEALSHVSPRAPMKYISRPNYEM